MLTYCDQASAVEMYGIEKEMEGIKKGKEEGIKEGIKVAVKLLKKMNNTHDKAHKELMNLFNLNEGDAKKYIDLCWN